MSVTLNPPSPRSTGATIAPPPIPAHTLAPTAALSRRQRGRLEQQRTLVRRDNTAQCHKMEQLIVLRCDALVDAKIADNAQSTIDCCPICQSGWTSFENDSFAAVPTCSHAMEADAIRKVADHIASGTQSESLLPLSSSLSL
eukprot:gene9986-12670_t